MAVLKDILAILDKWPTWRRMTEAPDRIEKLEKRMSELEDHLSAKPRGEMCPICVTGNLKVVKVSEDRDFGFAGVQRHDMECSNPSCEHKEFRVHDPNKLAG